MAVRIQNESLSQSPELQSSSIAAPAGSRTSGSSQSIGSAGGDQVELSSLSGTIASSLAASNSGNAARLSQLAAAYASGRYQVDALQLSKAIISHSLNSAAGA